ncbi:MAG: LCP family protein [bacterium]
MKGHGFDLARLLALLVILVGIIFFYLNIFVPSRLPSLFRIGVERQPLTLLLLGTDITYDAETGKPMPEKTGRADTILLARINPIKSKINLLSIPRDTYLEIPEFGWHKINAANAFGGVALMKETVEKLTGQQIDYYVEIKPTAISSMVDLIGGIYLEVDEDMKYKDHAQGLDIDLKKGWQKLSGKEAHDYIRFRTKYDGDIGRLSRQQKFLKAFPKALIRPSNILKAPLAIYITFKEIKTDLSVTKVIRLLNLIRTLPLEQIKPTMLAGEVDNLKQAGSVWIPNRQEVEQQLREFTE